MIQSWHCVYHPEHHSCFHPVIHQSEVGQSDCSETEALRKSSFGISVCIHCTRTHLLSAQSEMCLRSFMSLGIVRKYMKWKMIATIVMTARCSRAWMEIFHISPSFLLRFGLLTWRSQRGMFYIMLDINQIQRANPSQQRFLYIYSFS